jgi:hypothetical protein
VMAPDAARMRRAAVLFGLRKNSSDRPSICTQQVKKQQDQTKKEKKKTKADSRCTGSIDAVRTDAAAQMDIGRPSNGIEAYTLGVGTSRHHPSLNAHVQPNHTAQKKQPTPSVPSPSALLCHPAYRLRQHHEGASTDRPAPEAVGNPSHQLLHHHSQQHDCRSKHGPADSLCSHKCSATCGAASQVAGCRRSAETTARTQKRTVDACAA